MLLTFNLNDMLRGLLADRYFVKVVLQIFTYRRSLLRSTRGRLARSIRQRLWFSENCFAGSKVCAINDNVASLATPASQPIRLKVNAIGLHFLSEY